MLHIRLGLKQYMRNRKLFLMVVIMRMHANEEEKWGVRGGLVGGAAIEQVCGSV